MDLDFVGVGMYECGVWCVLDVFEVYDWFV